MKTMKTMKTTKSSNITVNDAINEYYNLKGKYDKKFDNSKYSIIRNYVLTLEEKRKEVDKLKKNRKCIICNNTGGTIFSDINGTLKAQCGNKSNPCNLQIEIRKGKIINLEELLNTANEDLENTKDDVIRLKLDLLFSFISEDQLIKNFQSIKKKMENELKIYEELSGQYINITNNRTKKEELQRKQIVLQMNIDEIKKLCQQYDNTGELSNIKDIVSIYLKEIIPLVDEMKNLKYSYTDVEYNDLDGTYHLIQKKYTIEDLEKTIIEPAVVIFSK